MDRNYNANDQVGQNAGEAVITSYDPKGVTKRQAGLLYNVGLGSGGLADATVPGDTNAATFVHRPRHANAVGSGTDVAYDLTADDSLMARYRPLFR